MFEEFSDVALVSAIGDSARAENKACARRLAAIAELYQRRQVPVDDGKARELWRIDPWEAVAAEVAAAQGITAAAAGLNCTTRSACTSGCQKSRPCSPPAPFRTGSST